MSVRVCQLCEASSVGTAVTFKRRHICDWCDAELKRTGRGYCHLCQKAKPLTEMHGTRPRCKACEAADSRKRYHANPEPTKARAARWAQLHRDRKREHDRRYIQSERSRARKIAREKAYHKTPHGRAKRAEWSRRYTERHAARLRANRRERDARRKLRILRGEL